jgi:hypothetical protein
LKEIEGEVETGSCWGIVEQEVRGLLDGKLWKTKGKFWGIEETFGKLSGENLKNIKRP